MIDNNEFSWPGENLGDALWRSRSTNGRIIACDPLIPRDSEKAAFLTSVSPGRYPVLLSVVTSESEPAYPRNVCAMLRPGTENRVRWVQALCRRTRRGLDLA
jgi:hypothetical protein